MKKNIISLQDYCERLNNGYFYDDMIQEMLRRDNFNTEILLGMTVDAAKDAKVKLTLIDDFDYEMWFWELYSNYEL